MKKIDEKLRETLEKEFTKNFHKNITNVVTKGGSVTVLQSDLGLDVTESEEVVTEVVTYVQKWVTSLEMFDLIFALFAAHEETDDPYTNAKLTPSAPQTALEGACNTSVGGGKEAQSINDALGGYLKSSNLEKRKWANISKVSIDVMAVANNKDGCFLKVIELLGVMASSLRAKDWLDKFEFKSDLMNIDNI